MGRGGLTAPGAFLAISAANPDHHGNASGVAGSITRQRVTCPSRVQWPCRATWRRARAGAHRGNAHTLSVGDFCPTVRSLMRRSCGRSGPDGSPPARHEFDSRPNGPRKCAGSADADLACVRAGDRLDARPRPSGEWASPRNHRLAPTAGVGWCRPPTADRTLTAVMAVLARVATSCTERSPPAILCSSQNRSRRDRIQRWRRTGHARTPVGGSDRGGFGRRPVSGWSAGGPDLWHRPGP